MDSYTKTISINSPAGSGNVFCQYLFERNLDTKIKWSHHNVLAFEQREGTHNIFLLRDPYDAVASGVEITILDTFNEKNQSVFFDDLDFKIKDKTIIQLAEYHRFMNIAERYDNVITTITFDFLTSTPDKCLEYVSKKFDIPFRKQGLSAERIKGEIKSIEDISTRVPREKSDLRKKIDLAVRDHIPLEYAYKQYILFRDNIQLTENIY
jgi:hypothetical protein